MGGLITLPLSDRGFNHYNIKYNIKKKDKSAVFFILLKYVIILMVNILTKFKSLIHFEKKGIIIIMKKRFLYY